MCRNSNHCCRSTSHFTRVLWWNTLISNFIADISEAANQKSNPKLACFPWQTAGIQIPGQLRRAGSSIPLLELAWPGRRWNNWSHRLLRWQLISVMGTRQCIQGAEPFPFWGLWHWPLVSANVCIIRCTGDGFWPHLRQPIGAKGMEELPTTSLLRKKKRERTPVTLKIQVKTRGKCSAAKAMAC